MNIILNRRSIRRYKPIKVSDKAVEDLLKAAMAAPSAGNQQPWEFIVIRDKSILEDIAKVHLYSQMLPRADVAIVVCGDENKEVFKGFWVQDCAAATENILLEAEYLGLGSVWLGVYPAMERTIAIKNLLNLPSSVIPLSIIAIGHPDEIKAPSNRYDETRIHLEKW